MLHRVCVRGGGRALHGVQAFSARQDLRSSGYERVVDALSARIVQRIKGHNFQGGVDLLTSHNVKAFGSQ